MSALDTPEFMRLRPFEREGQGLPQQLASQRLGYRLGRIAQTAHAHHADRVKWTRLDDIFEAALPRINEICDSLKLVRRENPNACPDFPPEPFLFNCDDLKWLGQVAPWRFTDDERRLHGIRITLPTDGFLLTSPEVSRHEPLPGNSTHGPWEMTHLHPRMLLPCMPKLRAWASKFFPHQKTSLDVSQSVAGQRIDIEFTHQIEGKRHLALVINFEPGLPQVQFKFPEGHDPSDW